MFFTFSYNWSDLILRKTRLSIFLTLYELPFVYLFKFYNLSALYLQLLFISSLNCLAFGSVFDLLCILARQYVDKDFGTGVLKISPGHDPNDYLLARKLGLPILNVMNKDGTLNEVAGLYR